MRPETSEGENVVVIRSAGNPGGGVRSKISPNRPGREISIRKQENLYVGPLQLAMTIEGAFPARPRGLNCRSLNPVNMAV
jgi:hypothetical protein